VDVGCLDRIDDRRGRRRLCRQCGQKLREAVDDSCRELVGRPLRYEPLSSWIRQTVAIREGSDRFA
jgi:hypothetical protein